MTADRTATVRCWYRDDWRKEKNIFGRTLWTFDVEPNWCGNGRWVTSAYDHTWGTTSRTGWEHDGLTQSSNRWGTGWNIYENVRQGHSCYIDHYRCVQNRCPCVDVEVGAGGQIHKS